MPLTVIDIERRKKWRIALLYGVLLIMYLLTAMVLYAGLVIVFFPFAFLRSAPWDGVPVRIGIIIGGAVVISIVHFWFSASTVIRSIVRTLNAVPPDPEDGIHRRLLNVVDEVRIMTGKRKITCLVVPSLSLNALAASDLKGAAVIAITEGLLSRLSRPQLEAVIAHEAYHILSGDCTESTVATSLFGMYVSLLEKLESWAEVDRRASIHPTLLSIRGLLILSNMLSMVISREREYRADAAAVRMTRNPVAMAEALYLISRNWTGSGMISSGLDMLCLASPDPDAYDESESWFANMLSTHPPLRKRIAMVLKYAHSTINAFERKHKEKELQTAGESAADKEDYYALDSKKQWQGPFSVADLCSLAWINPQTWIAGSIGDIRRASDVATLSSALWIRIAETPSPYICPSCKKALEKAEYENTQVHQCIYCGGILVENSKLPRIIARREVDCTKRVKALAHAVVKDNQHAMAIRKLKSTGKRQMTGVTCSKCGNSMFRTFYSGAYLIEIDRCGICGLMWFEIDELEMLQCLIENKITGRLGMEVYP